MMLTGWQRTTKPAARPKMISPPSIARTPISDQFRGLFLDGSFTSGPVNKEERPKLHTSPAEGQSGGVPVRVLLRVTAVAIGVPFDGVPAQPPLSQLPRRAGPPQGQPNRNCLFFLCLWPWASPPRHEPLPTLLFEPAASPQRRQGPRST
jgi:hypothetical protein